MSINHGIPVNEYLGSPIDLRLPTIDIMSDRVRDLWPGCLMNKLDLSREYRELHLDPLDWPLMSIKHEEKIYLDVCPPFGLRTSAMMMERTTMVASYFHGLYGFLSRPYIDDFGDSESESEVAYDACGILQGVLGEVGL